MLFCPWKICFNQTKEELYKKYKEAYELFESTNLLQDYVNTNKTSAVWNEIHKEIFDNMKYFNNLYSFKKNKKISASIYNGGGELFLERAEKTFGKEIVKSHLQMYQEELIGLPEDIVNYNGNYITKTAMRHFYHMLFLKKYITELLPKNDITIIEIGGGFGNLPRLMGNMNLYNKYIIIDLPVMLWLQYYYLSIFFPNNSIAVIDENGNYVKGDFNSKITLMTPSISSKINNFIIGDKFLVSTLALSEVSSEIQQEYLTNINPDFIYIYGEKEHLTRANGKYMQDRLNNTNFIYSLFRLFNHIVYEDYGYYFEYFGRNKCIFN